MNRIGWLLAALLAIALTASLAGIVSGGPLDPPGPPAPTGPIQAVLQQPSGRVIQVALNVIVPHQVAAATPTPAATTTSTPTATTTSTATSTATGTAASTGTVVPPAVQTLLGYFDVRDCGKIDAFVQAVLVSPDPSGGAANVHIRLAQSIDGASRARDIILSMSGPILQSLDVTPYLDPNPISQSATSGFGVTPFGRSPFVGVFVERGDNQPADAKISVWLYCSSGS